MKSTFASDGVAEMSLIFYRVGHRLHRMGIPVFPKLCTVLGQVVFGSYIPAECLIGSKCKVAYGGSGLIVHPRAVIGDNCLLSPGVVIGGRGEHYDVPRIGNNVRLFPGAKVLGPITIGDRATVGANAVVVENVNSDDVFVSPKATRLARAED